MPDVLPATCAGVDKASFGEEILTSGLLTRTGVEGVYGRSREFEETLDRVDRMVMAAGASDRPEILRFPPTLSRADFAASGYLESFPHLAGTISCFDGDERGHRALMRAVEDGADWSSELSLAELVLTPAACYPVYPMLSGVLSARGRVIDVMSYCYRHEPSHDVGRMQIFRMHEQVVAGDAEMTRSWRNAWCVRVLSFVEAIGLVATLQPAADPFFGRGGKLLAESQRERGLKLEVVATIASDEQPTAIISLNDHQQHFGERFGITAATGGAAFTSCVGFGLERITLALYRRHGLNRSRWPAAVREALAL
jgi:seryl-tRNA synthetase